MEPPLPPPPPAHLPADFAPLTLVRFEPAHQDGLVRLVTDAYADYDQEIELDTLDADLLRVPELFPPPRSAFWVLVDSEDTVRGSVGIHGERRGQAELKRLYLARTLRGRGLGHRLALQAVDWARRQRYNTLLIRSDTRFHEAHALYARLGAADTGRRRTLGGVNDVEERCFILRLDRVGPVRSPYSLWRQEPMTASAKTIGQTPAGESVAEYTLESRSGVRARVLTWGAILASVEAPDRDGNVREITLGFDALAGWLGEHPYFGATVGRYGNRIAGARFELDGVEYPLTANEGANQLHGGRAGFDKKVWAARDASTEAGDAVELSLTSPDGDEGFPGELVVRVRYTLTPDGELRIDYAATTDRATHVNLTNHTYWNLAGAGSGNVLDHQLEIAASRYLPVGEGLIPTGELRAVAGTPLDFTAACPIGSRIGQVEGGYDLCYVVDGEPGVLRRAASVRDPGSGRTLEVWTTEPGIQLYTGNFLDGIAGRGGARFEKQDGFCLEAQHFPDSPNRPEFPSTVLQPGATYRQTTAHRFGVR